MRFLRRRRAAYQPIDLNVIPLIDVVFFLLIFYVISTSFVSETAVSISRPRSTQATSVSGGFVAVAILRTGAIQVGPQVVDLGGVGDAVRAALASGNTGRVVIIPDREVPAGLLLGVHDACAGAGATAIEVAATRAGAG
jgi:biopolymer transport protein ExbD